MQPIYEIEDSRFRALIQPNAHLERLATGLRWAEGPVWFPAFGVLHVSDIPNDRILRITPEGDVSVFRDRSGFANGHTRDREGRMVSCHHGTRSVTRTEHDGRVTVIADAYEGRRLNSPNDVVVSSDGAIWFTDPTYGILGNYEGHRAAREQPCNGVYRAGPEGGLDRVIDDAFVQPNGLAFAPDERTLYVAESGSSHDPDVPPVVRAFPVEAGRCGPGRDLFAVDAGLPDGLRVDRHGHIWCSAGDGVQVFDAAGVRLGRIRVPEVVANLAFGGPRGNRLFIAATTSVYAVYVESAACGWPVR